MFRPAGVYRNACAVAECEGVEIARRKTMIFTPGEMAVLPVKKEKFIGLHGSEIIVRIEGEEQHG